ncbi:MAG: translation initiation factor IF-2 [Bacteroidetes bacterium]|nr:translation initiation factor IF-2 [Bacteroidota bacterium]
MAEEVKALRLAKAASTYNVSLEHIVETLKKAKHEVDNKPTTKLTPEQIAILDKEFGSDKAIKQAADTANKKEEVITPVVEAPVVSKKVVEEEKEVLVKNNLAQKTKAKETEEEAPEMISARKKAVVELKVVDKVDLDAEKKKKAAAKKKKEEVVEEEKAPVVVAKPVDDKVLVRNKAEAEPEASEKIETKYQTIDGIKEVGRIDLKQFEAKPKKKEEAAPASGEKKVRERKLIKKKERAPLDDQYYDKKVENFQKRRDQKPTTNTPAAGGTPEITEKQIEEKIRATMAKIQAQTSKSDRSKFRREKREAIQEKMAAQEAAQDHGKLKVTEFMTVSELASLMNVPAVQVITTCMQLGVMVSLNQRLDAEILELVAGEHGFEVEFQSAEETTAFKEEEVDKPEDLKSRAPIVTIMGHVDHGKTSLLDFIRKANVVAKEAGGITQHIGAYEVTTNSGRKITFLDTPGHEAFTAMRARGAKVTDVAVIVIAADDAVMPQTKEAINHAQSAGVPMIFAFNKIDKDGANADRIREQLSQMNILVEEWGGKFQSQEISAKKGLNIDALLDKILIEADLLDLKANPDKNASGSVIEATLDKGRGYTATVLVDAGTLKRGDILVCGPYQGRVKAMFNHLGSKIETAGPSSPVQLLGLSGAPQAGERFKVFDSEAEAKELATKRAQLERETGIRTKKHITLDEIGRRLALGNFKELNLIIKGDVDGSVEALTDSLLKLSTEEIQVKVIHRGVGQISEADVNLAAATDAIIIGFNVRPSVSAKKLAENENIEIKLYSIIYKAIEDVKSAMEGLMEPTIEEKIIGNIDVREAIHVSKVGTIAGCFVREGKVLRSSKVRVIREGIVIHNGSLASLKRFKDDVKEVVSGMECGLQIKDFQDIKGGDIIEVFEETEVIRKL